MAIEQSATEAVVKIRMPVRRSGVWYVVFAGSWFGFWLAGLSLIKGPRWGALPWLAFGCCFVALGLVRRATGVDLTPEAAVVRHPTSRQSVQWSEVQAVTSHVNSNGASAVWLVLKNGQPVKLRYPATLWRKGDAGYEQDFRRIDQWWLAHRGDAGHTENPDATEPPKQE